MTAETAKFIWLAFFIAHFALRFGARVQAWKTPIRQTARDTSGAVLLFLARFSMAGLPILYLVTDFPSAADYPFHPLQGYLGAALSLVVLWIFYLTHRDLGGNWSHSLDVREKHSLVTTGIYGRVRHPMYSGFWLMALVNVLLLPNWVVGPAGLVMFGILFFVRVPREEAMMIDAFGDEYRSYMERTGRVFPKLR